MLRPKVMEIQLHAKHRPGQCGHQAKFDLDWPSSLLSTDWQHQIKHLAPTQIRLNLDWPSPFPSMVWHHEIKLGTCQIWPGLASHFFPWPGSIKQQPGTLLSPCLKWATSKKRRMASSTSMLTASSYWAKVREDLPLYWTHALCNVACRTWNTILNVTSVFWKEAIV